MNLFEKSIECIGIGTAGTTKFLKTPTSENPWQNGFAKK
jgi:hypothetical protein